MDDRRKHISFKNNDRENELLKWINKMSETYGFSTYIKILIENDMKANKGGSDCDSIYKSR